MLAECDPESAAAIHANNRQRVIRALEYFHQTGKKFSTHNETEREKTSPYNFAYFVLTRNRAALYETIEQRIDEMLASGLVEEVRSLVDTYHLTTEDTSMQGIGYKEILGYLNGEYDLPEAIRILKTRHQTLCKASAYLVSAGTGRNLARQGYLKHKTRSWKNAIMTHLAEKNIR
mgnify:CR=1 FL=1